MRYETMPLHVGGRRGRATAGAEASLAGVADVAYFLANATMFFVPTYLFTSLANRAALIMGLVFLA